MTQKLTFGRAGIDAGVAHTELERIRAQYGLTASAVVQQSRPKDAPLHPAFEWDDKAAAEQHRLWQARQIIRAVHVVYETDGRKEPVYVHIPKPPERKADDPTAEGRYERVDVVVRSPDLFAVALTELQGKVRSAVNAVEELQRAAQQGNEPDRMVKIGLAVKALETAQSAIAALH